MANFKGNQMNKIGAGSGGKTLLLAGVLALSLNACTTTELIEGTQATTQLITLEASYNHAKGAIYSNLHNFDDTEQEQLRNLMDRADLLTGQLDNAWRTGDLSTTSLDILFNEGRSIYSDAYSIIEPNFATLSADSKIKLAQIQDSVVSIEKTYIKIRDTAGERAAKAKLLWNSASLALKLALVAL